MKIAFQSIFSNNKSAQVIQEHVIHPNWPTIWPRLLTDGKTYELTGSTVQFLDNARSHAEYNYDNKLVFVH